MGSVEKQSGPARLGRGLPSRVALLSRRVQHLDVVQREAVSDVRHVLLEDGGLVEGQRRLQRLVFTFDSNTIPFFRVEGTEVNLVYLVILGEITKLLTA